MLRMTLLIAALLMLASAAFAHCCRLCYDSPMQLQYGAEFDRNFVFLMGYNQDYDRRLAHLGVEKATDPQVKAIANQAFLLHQDRFQLFEGHVTWAYAWPGIAGMDPDRCASLQTIAQLSGRVFDQEWVRAMIAADQRDLCLAQQGAEKSTLISWRRDAKDLIDDTNAEIEQLQGLPH